MATRTRKRPKAYQLKTGPWKGCFESWDSSPETEDTLFAATNCLFRNAQARLAAQARPGFINLGRLGAGANRTPQCIYNHTTLDGSEYRFVFIGGKLYDWNADTFAGVFTDITPGAVAISTTARIFCTTFANLLIVSDGVNRPWTYDANALVATYIQFNTAADAWNAYGPPVVYGAKLFFILNTVAAISRRNEVAWSEEAAPATGYFQNTFDNLWELTQTDSDALFCLCPTNTGLYFFRADSIGCIQGLVNANFKTTAVQDATSLTVGTTSAASVVQAGQYIFFADRLGRPHRLVVGGGGVEELWRQLVDTSDAFLSMGAAGLFNAERWFCAGYHQDLNVVVMVLWRNTSVFAVAPSSVMYTFDAESGAYTGIWQTAQSDLISCLGLLRDSSRRQNFMMGVSLAGASDGYVYAQQIMGGFSNTGVADSYYKDGSSAYPISVQTRQLNDDASEEWLFDRIDVEFAGYGTNRSAFTATIGYSTSRSAPSAQSITTAASTLGTQRASVGIMGRGRSISVTATLTASLVFPAGFNRIQVLAYPDANDPGIP